MKNSALKALVARVTELENKINPPKEQTKTKEKKK